MYQVIGHPRTRTMRVYWMLEELGQDYDVLIAPAHSEAAKAANPSGKIPALNVGGKVLLDSVAILQFLADKHGALSYPSGTLERAEQDSFTQFCADEMDSVLWNATKHKAYYPEELRVPAAIAGAKYDFGRAMDTLAVRLGDKAFVMGDKITVPDILIGHCALWAKGAEFPLPDGPLAAYFARLAKRPALQRAREKSGYFTL